MRNWMSSPRKEDKRPRNSNLMIHYQIESPRREYVSVVIYDIYGSISTGQRKWSNCLGSRWARTKTKTFLECPGQNFFRTVEKSLKSQFGKSRAPKNATFWPFSLSWGYWPICAIFWFPTPPLPPLKKWCQFKLILHNAHMIMNLIAYLQIFTLFQSKSAATAEGNFLQNQLCWTSTAGASSDW